MTKGIGTDIIEVARIAKSIQRLGQHFLDRIFTPEEQSYCLKYQASERHFAGRFAAKEAIAKALGTGIDKNFSWHDASILNDEKGQPYVVMSPAFKKRFPGITILISISHTHEFAVAFALIDYKPNGLV